MLEKVKSEYMQEENAILEKLYDNIDNNISTIMNSGAGSGKTYALIQCLKHVVSKYGNTLKNNNQHIICITYTNVAANEIKDRLGNTDIVQVSTIHERLWDIISLYKKELVEIHIENIKNNISQIDNDLVEKDAFSKYKSLDIEERKAFVELMLNDDKKAIFYSSYKLKATEFKNEMREIQVNPILLDNVANFKKLVSKIYKREKYKKCLDDIEENRVDSLEVKYDARYNTDRLEYFKISHDTLLDYAEKMIEKYGRLKDIIIDTYPYIFVDEYQDTNQKVVEILKSIEERAKESGRGHDFYIGYFGDNVQNIYSDGVGSKIFELNKFFDKVNKRFNRRSCAEVVWVANAIRRDDIQQVSIFEDCNGGSVKFYHGSEDSIDKFISKYRSEFVKKSTDKLHCFMLTNESVAVYTGIENIYNAFKNTDYYKQHYNQLSSELLSNEPEKLGDIPSLIYRLVNFFVLLNNDKTPIYDILDKEICKNLNIEELNNIFDCLKAITASDLGTLIDRLCSIYSDMELEKNNAYKILIENLFNTDNISFKKISQYFFEKLFNNENEDDYQNSLVGTQQIFNISMDEYIKWYNYINRDESNDVVYHTYHGTKGLEFDNVVIIMGNSFGILKNFFNVFFKNYNNENNLDNSKKKTYTQARNLLYVSVTRTIKNLRILYTDPIEGFKDNLKLIFNEIYEF